jgi:hypothetical protein
LPRGRLTLAGGQHAAEENFVDFSCGESGGGETGAFDGGADGGSTELRSGETAEIALECADGGARGAGNHDGIGFGHGRSLILAAFLTRGENL